MVAFADDKLRVREVELFVQRCAVRALHAVRRPKNLLTVRQADGFERLAARVRRGEGNVVTRMPVLREDDIPEARAQAIHERHDLMAARHGERAAGHEVVLQIDDDQDCFFGSRRISTSVRSAAV
jgi:hypothetical protein